jgi:isocitrate dehydrogenase
MIWLVLNIFPILSQKTFILVWFSYICLLNFKQIYIPHPRYHGYDYKITIMTQKNCLHLNRWSTFISDLLFLPIVQAFTATAGIEIVTEDISLAARINFPEYLTEEQRVKDSLTELGKLATAAEISLNYKYFSIGAAIKSYSRIAVAYNILISQKTQKLRREKQAKLSTQKHLDLHPVLKGNSDRRAPRAVKTMLK